MPWKMRHGPIKRRMFGNWDVGNVTRNTPTTCIVRIPPKPFSIAISCLAVCSARRWNIVLPMRKCAHVAKRASNNWGRFYWWLAGTSQAARA